MSDLDIIFVTGSLRSLALGEGMPMIENLRSCHHKLETTDSYIKVLFRVDVTLSSMTVPLQFTTAH